MTLSLRAFFCAALLAATATTSASAQSSAPCGLPNAAFCDTFDKPEPNSGLGTRAGDLDSEVWGASRGTSADNPSQGGLTTWPAVTTTICGTTQTVAPPADLKICNGQLVDAVNDAGALTEFAWYPRQPFDIAGRTGTIVFDVNADSRGSHSAWPSIVYTDQPIPAPGNGLDPARNSFGFSLDETAGGACGENGTTVSSMWTSTNFTVTGVPVKKSGCVAVPKEYGQLNHFEVRISPTHVEVWGTDPGTRDNLHQIASADVQMPLTRGLVWMADGHYNAGKESPSQREHAFVWDNFGFDGPILPRDLGTEYPDATGDNGTTSGNLGYHLPGTAPRTFDLTGVHGVENASGALIEFTSTPWQQGSWTYSFNGHASQTQTRAQMQPFASNTFAFPVNVSDLVDGTNQFTISTDTAGNMGPDIANIDLILVGAGPAVGPSGAAAPASAPSAPAATPPPADQPPAAPPADQPAAPPAADQPAAPQTDQAATPPAAGQPAVPQTDQAHQAPAVTPSDADATAPSSDVSSAPSDVDSASTCEVQVRINGQLVWRTAPPELCQ
jgi:hypothetical protein